MFDTTEIFRGYQRYSRWMNEKLLAECSKLSDEERKAPSGAPFGSLHGLWNHLLLADKAWVGRITGETFAPKSLGEELYSDWDELKAERTRVDDKIAEIIAGLDNEKLSAPLVWRAFTNPNTFSMPLALVLTHMFNHQTHHRGQITALIEQNGLDCGVTDFLQTPGLPLKRLD